MWKNFKTKTVLVTIINNLFRKIKTLKFYDAIYINN